MVSFMVPLGLLGARSMTQALRLPFKQDNYCNPLCACAPRVNYTALQNRARSELRDYLNDVVCLYFCVCVCALCF